MIKGEDYLWGKGSSVRVRDIMHLGLVSVSPDTPLREVILDNLLKHRVSAVPVTSAQGLPLGVVSKSDMVAAYYGGMPLDTPVRELMVSPVEVCRPKDDLSGVVQRMFEQDMQRIFVQSDSPTRLVGVVSFIDIVRLVNTSCQRCHQLKQLEGPLQDQSEPDFLTQPVQRVMSARLVRENLDSPISKGIEAIDRQGVGSLLISGEAGKDLGVVSKQDLMRAYAQEIPLDRPLELLTQMPVISVSAESPLQEAVDKMLHFRIHRIFVRSAHENRIMGMVSFSRAASISSGSCGACAITRLIRKS